MTFRNEMEFSAALDAANRGFSLARRVKGLTQQQTDGFYTFGREKETAALSKSEVRLTNLARVLDRTEGRQA